MGQEGLEYDSTSGALSTFDTWEYKPPQSLDIPIKWATTLLKDVKNPTGFHGTYVHFSLDHLLPLRSPVPRRMFATGFERPILPRQNQEQPLCDNMT